MLTIFKGDDTGGVIGKRITLNIETEIPVENCKLVFSFCSTRREFTNIVSGQDIEIFFSHNETQMFPLGTSRANLTLVDASGKVRTLSNSLQIRVTNNVAECYGSDAQSATVTIRAVVSWENIANKPTAFPPEAHTHLASHITNLSQALSTWWDSFKSSVRIGWNQIIELPQGKSLSSVAKVEKSADGKKLTVTPVLGEPFEFRGGDEQVQADWNQADSTQKSFIRNKPTIPDEQVNADWEATSGKAQILNKPNLSLKRDYTDLSYRREGAGNGTFRVVVGSDDRNYVWKGDAWKDIDSFSIFMIFTDSGGYTWPTAVLVGGGPVATFNASEGLEGDFSDALGVTHHVKIYPYIPETDTIAKVSQIPEVPTSELTLHVSVGGVLDVDAFPFKTPNEIVISQQWESRHVILTSEFRTFFFNGGTYFQSLELPEYGIYRITKTVDGIYIVEYLYGGNY